MILILVCKLLFEVTKPWSICGIHPWLQEQWFLVLFVVKSWLVFVRECGKSERISYALLLVVKLLQKLKHVINVNSQKSYRFNVGNLKVMFRLHLFFFFFSRRRIADVFSGGIAVYQLWSFSAANMRRERCGRGCGNAADVVWLASCGCVHRKTHFL